MYFSCSFSSSLEDTSCCWKRFEWHISLHDAVDLFLWHGIVKIPVPFAWLSCDLDGVQTEKSHDWSWQRVVPGRSISSCVKLWDTVCDIKCFIYDNTKGGFYSQHFWCHENVSEHSCVATVYRYEKAAHCTKSGQRTIEIETEPLTRDTSVTIRKNVSSFLTQLSPLCPRVHSNASVHSRNRVAQDSNMQNTKQSWRLARQCQWSNVNKKMRRVVLMQYWQF